MFSFGMIQTLFCKEHVLQGCYRNISETTITKSEGMPKTMHVWIPKYFATMIPVLDGHYYHQFSQWLLFHLTQFYQCYQTKLDNRLPT